MSADPYETLETLETPEALDRAMRLIHARRGADDTYRAELQNVFHEIFTDALNEVDDPDDDNEPAWDAVRLWMWRANQLVHALVRISSITALSASPMSGALKMSPIDVLKLADDSLRADDDNEGLDAA